jgi:RimJ/RimL family protein N-acetyltransferase
MDAKKSPIIVLRPVVLQDADVLLAWRNDQKTRNFCHNTAEVRQEDHLTWLLQAIANPNRRLFIAEENGIPVGTIRADWSANAWELSWTVAPDARGRGVAKRMVALLAQEFFAPIRAEVKAGNTISCRVAEYAGMTLAQEIAGTLHYCRD